MKRIWIGRLLLFCTPFLVAAVICELWLRAKVPRCGVTPFQVSSLDGVAHELRPNFKTLYKGQNIRINSDGFRGEEFAAPAESRVRLALVGDSVTFGNAIPIESTLAVLLEERLRRDRPRIEVLNCGVPGYNAANVRQLLKHRVLRLDPDFVVYVFVSNDVSPSRGRVKIPPDATIDSFHSFPLRSAFLQWAGVTVKGILRQLGPGSDSGTIAQVARSFSDGGREQLRDAIGAMGRLCRQHKIPFAVATYPFLTTPNPYAEIDDWVVDYCRREGIQVVDLRHAYGKDEMLTKYWANTFDPHPNHESNRLVCDYLAEQILPELSGRTPGK